jgi:hypothetical protein
MAKNIEGLHNDSPFNATRSDRFTTLSPAQESFTGNNLADPPPFNGEEPPNTIGLCPEREGMGKRRSR